MRIVSSLFAAFWLSLIGNGSYSFPVETFARARGSSLTLLPVGEHQSFGRSIPHRYARQHEEKCSFGIQLAGTHLKDANDAGPESLRLAQQGLQALSRPSVVSLPVGVLLALALLPFLVSKLQALLTFVMFGGLTSFQRRVRGPKESINNNDGSSNTMVWDALSLGVAIAAGSWVTSMFFPSPMVPTQHVTVAAVQSSGTGSSFPFLPLMGLAAAGITVLFLSPKMTLPSVDKKLTIGREDGANQSLEDSWEAKLRNEVQERLFNSWDEEMETREV